MLRAVISAILGTLFVGAVSSADWPQWRGPNRDGKSGDKELNLDWPKEGPPLLWHKSGLELIGSGYGTPAVVGDKLYLCGGSSVKKSKEFCVCMNVKDGSKVWKRELETTPAEDKFKYLQDWGGGPRSTPTVDGDHLYFLGSTGDLRCLTTAEGKVEWSVDVVKKFGGEVPRWGYSESVLVDGDKVLCTPGGDGGLVALNKKTGAKIWQCKEFKDETGYSSMIVATIGDVKQYVQQTGKAGVGVRADDGKLLWRVAGLKRKTAVAPTPVMYEDSVFFTGGYNAGCELFKLEPDGKGTKATKQYTGNDVVSNHHGGVIEYEGKLYGHSDKNQWVCFDFLKGSDEPTWASKKLEKGSISYAAGHFFCYGENEGTLVVIKASDKSWEESGRFKIPETSEPRAGTKGKVWAHPVIANGILYLRDFEHLYAYDLRPAKK